MGELDDSLKLADIWKDRNGLVFWIAINSFSNVLDFSSFVDENSAGKLLENVPELFGDDLKSKIEHRRLD